MSSIKVFPAMITDFTVGRADGLLYGIGEELQLPEIAYLTEDLKGAGIAGAIKAPAMGHTEAMEMEFKWRTIEKAALQLAGSTGEVLDLRAVQQVITSQGKQIIVPVRITISVIPLAISLGKYGQWTTSDTTNKFSVLALTGWVDGEKLIDIDKLNAKHEIGGIDHMAEIRKHLGI